MLIALSAAAIALGAAACWRARERSAVERLGLLLLPWLTAAALVQWIHVWLATPWNHWNASRLAPTIAILQGISPYCSREAGSIQTTMYPPGNYLAYLPAGLAPSPTAAILVASALTLGYLVLAPLAVFLVAAGRGRGRLLLALLGALTLLLFGAFFQPVADHLKQVHADAPALFHGTLSCLFLFLHRADRRWPLWAAACCVSLSIWSKQTMAPCAVALPLFLYWLHGWSVARRFLEILLIVGLSTSALMLLFVSPSELMFLTISMPAAFELKHGGLGAGLRTFLDHGWPTFALVALALVHAPLGGARIREWARSDPSAILIVVALFLTPLSVLGQAKYGGGPNSYHNLYFLQVAALCLFLRGARALALDPATPGLLRLSRSGLLLLPSGLAVAVVVSFRTGSIADQLELLPGNAQQVAYEYSLEHPGEIWFPCNPLSNLMANRRLEHEERSVGYWQVAGESVTAERLLASIQPSVKHIAYPSNQRLHPKNVVRVLADVLVRGKSAKLSALPGWQIYHLP